MAAAGILNEDDPVELIEGEIVEMPPMGSPHAACISRLTHMLVPRAGNLVSVRVQLPVRLDERSEPEPDLALVKSCADSYASAHPGPEDVLLVIEVADTSVEYDRNVKLPLYARAGIPEAWLIILPKDLIEVHSEPKNGKYQKVQRLKRGKTLVSATISELKLKVGDILG